MKFHDYYQILGVARTDGAEAIRRAYRRLARKYHPDISKEPEAEARMKEINEAYAVLSDPEKRAAYDQLARGYQAGQEFRPPPEWHRGFAFSSPGSSSGEASEFSDFFAELFGRLGGRPRAGFGKFSEFGEFSEFSGYGQRGEDHHAQVTIPLADAWTGARREISLTMPRQDASGRVSRATRTLELRIPAGIREGQTVRLAGQGAPGLAGGPPGDLYLEVHFEPQPGFRVDGRDLHAALPVAPWEAALGATIALPLPTGGTLKVRLPAGVQSGRQLKVKGKGIPGDPPGDLLLEVRVVLPEASTPQARKLYETMARELAFDPRAGIES